MLSDAVLMEFGCFPAALRWLSCYDLIAFRLSRTLSRFCFVVLRLLYGICPIAFRIVCVKLTPKSNPKRNNLSVTSGYKKRP
jgi:hypothetical protein